MAKRRRSGIALAILDKLEPGEEAFPLIGRDRATPIMIKMWAHLWLQEIAMGLRPETDRAQITDALRMATRIEIWQRDRRQRLEHQATEFAAPLPDGSRVPASGEHAKRERNTTSGANDAIPVPA